MVSPIYKGKHLTTASAAFKKNMGGLKLVRRTRNIAEGGEVLEEIDVLVEKKNTNEILFVKVFCEEIVKASIQVRGMDLKILMYIIGKSDWIGRCNVGGDFLNELEFSLSVKKQTIRMAISRLKKLGFINRVSNNVIQVNTKLAKHGN